MQVLHVYVCVHPERHAHVFGMSVVNTILVYIYQKLTLN